jgi:hypothetical protein
VCISSFSWDGSKTARSGWQPGAAAQAVTMFVTQL